MRAHIKRGFPAWELQGRINRWYQERTKVDSRGWPIPFSVQQGFERLASAHWHRRYRLTILGKLLSPYERSEYLRLWKINMAEAKACEAPRLP